MERFRAYKLKYIVMKDEILVEYKQPEKVGLRILARWIAEDLLKKQAEKDRLLRKNIVEVKSQVFDIDLEQSIEDF